jgi:hypothetical protein
LWVFFSKKSTTTHRPPNTIFFQKKQIQSTFRPALGKFASMKSLLLLPFALAFLACPAAAQVADTDTMETPRDTFFLERWSRQIGQQSTFSQRPQFVVRLGSGVRQHYTSFTFFVPYREPPSLPLETQFGLRWWVFEAGLRHSPGGLPLSQGQSAILGAATNLWPVSAAYRLTGGYGRVSLRLLDVPFFVAHGRNRLDGFKGRRERTVSSNGTIQTLTQPGAFSMFEPNIKFFSRNWTFGLEMRHFWVAYNYERIFLLRPETNRERIANISSITAGVQFSTGGGSAFARRLPNKQPKNRPVQLVAGTNLLYIPWRQSAASTGYFLEMGVRVHPHFRLVWWYSPVSLRNIHGFGSPRIQFKPSGTSGDLAIATDPYFTDGHGPSFQLLVDRVWHTESAWQPIFRAGFAYSRLELPTQWVSYLDFNGNFISTAVRNAMPFQGLGLTAGGGFDYSLVSVRAMLHRPFGEFPLFLEVSAGVRLGFF